MVASDPGITGKMTLGHCLSYAIALGDVLLQRSGIYSQAFVSSMVDSEFTVAIKKIILTGNPVRSEIMGAQAIPYSAYDQNNKFNV